MNPSAQLDYQREALRDLVANVKPEQMSSSTPCADWDVRSLMSHFVGGAGMFAAAFSGQELDIDPEAPMPDLVGDDPLGAFDGAIGLFSESVDKPGAIDRMVTLPFGTLPGPMVLELLKFDLLVHCWDLATATGQPFDPPADTVEQSLQTAQMMISPALRGGPFADEVTVRGSATPIERLVAFTGRNV
ncbi:MAG: hypothetical protein QOF59_2325 [Actinomycetota bacterium]|nr:hypothetical protein [Actinomycetota bacterium]